MGDLRDVLERAAEGYKPQGDQWDRTMTRARRRERRRRIGAGSVALLVAVGGLAGAVVAFRPSGFSTSVAPTTPATSTLAPAVHLVRDRTLPLGQLGGLVAAQEASGSVWAVLIINKGKEELVRADPTTGVIERRFPITNFPAQEWAGPGLAVGGGELWVAGADAGFKHGIITRIDPATDAEETIEIKGRGVVDVAFDSGILWALVSQNTRGDANVVSIDPSTGSILSSVAFHADWYGGIVPAGSNV